MCVSSDIDHTGLFSPRSEEPHKHSAEGGPADVSLDELLTASFRVWLADCATVMPWAEDGVMLFAGDGRLLDAEGVRSEAFSKLMTDCAAAALRTHEPAEAQACSEAAVRAIPITGDGESITVAVLVFALRPGTDGDAVRMLMGASALHYRSRYNAAAQDALLRGIIECQRAEDRDAKRKDELYMATKRLHDQIDVPSVLKEAIEGLERLYPYAEVDLFLSQDYAAVDRRVKPLVIKHSAGDLCARAFLEGKPVMERAAERTKIAVPLSGKQAVYGVLHLDLAASRWDEAELPGFVMLAEQAGSAFEHAKLYEQSNLLIAELQLINDMAKRLNQSLRPNEIFNFATNELLDVFDADFCCVLQYNRQSAQFVVMSSNIPALLEEAFSAEYGFCGIIHQTREPIIISDYRDAGGVESRLMEETGARSLIASPIFVRGEVGGVILVAHRSANYFSYDNYKLLQVLSTHIGLAITNASLHAEVRRMVITDNLTGLHARHYLNEQIQSKQRKDSCGSLILVDIDYFKRVNDTFGHQIGDRILMQVSGVIKSCIRESDIAARWGGEELAVYLPKVRTEQAYRIAERIRMRVEQETDPGVTASCGVSEWTFEDEKISPESLFYRADMALYEAKHHGRNQVFVG